MRISARNVLKGTITDVEIGAVSGVVSIKVGETALISIITMEAIHDLSGAVYFCRGWHPGICRHKGKPCHVRARR